MVLIWISHNIGGEKFQKEVIPSKLLSLFFPPTNVHTHNSLYLNSIWNIGGPHQYVMDNWVSWIIFGCCTGSSFWTFGKLFAASRFQMGAGTQRVYRVRAVIITWLGPLWLRHTIPYLPLRPPVLALWNRVQRQASLCTELSLATTESGKVRATCVQCFHFREFFSWT